MALIQVSEPLQFTQIHVEFHVVWFKSLVVSCLIQTCCHRLAGDQEITGQLVVKMVFPFMAARFRLVSYFNLPSHI